MDGRWFVLATRMVAEMKAPTKKAGDAGLFRAADTATYYFFLLPPARL